MKGVSQVTVTALDKRYKLLERDLTDRTRKILLLLKQRGAALEIYLVGGATMRKLNRQYRGKDEATNVLAFESPRNFPEIRARSLGEIYLCPSHIKRRGEDIQLMLAHGILHLSGFNHETESDRMTMEKMEEKLLTWLNP